VTPLKDMQLKEKTLTMPPIGGEIMQEAIASYLANPIFRAARYEELVLDDNPYRRPVRPDDIGLVDFSAPLTRANFAQLSGLMGHRMLLNIYDCGKLFLPQQPTPQKWRDFEQFYAEGSRFLGDLIRPYLQAHLFGFLAGEARQEDARTAAGASALVSEIAADRHRCADELRDLVRSSLSQDAMIGMLSIQAAATSLNTSTQPTSALHRLASAGRQAGLPAALGVTGTAHRQALGDGRSGEIKYEPHSYYQYYLPSTLALMNYINGAAQDPGQVFALVGALVAQSAEAAAMRAALEPAPAERLGGAAAAAAAGAISVWHQGSAGGPAYDSVAGLVEQVGGEFAVREFCRGMADYAVLLDVHHEERMRQFSWINAMPEYVAKARRLQGAIREHGIEVDLDTFIESCEECSTTHVHDEDRLLVIESGEMEFWNCFGMSHKFRPGDMAFIPRHHLHGSVVLSGECVYHQPVITQELNQRFG